MSNDTEVEKVGNTPEVYTSHKRVLRTEMNRGDSNHENHKGYISWSPKEQFDNGYTLETGTGAHLARI